MHKIGLLLSCGGALFAAKPVLNSETFWDRRSVTDPQITRDGKSVIYVLGWSDKMVDHRFSNLWVVSRDGKDNRPLTTGSYRDTSPRIWRNTPTSRRARFRRGSRQC
jgi:Tol biopolymer transport system component